MPVAGSKGAPKNHGELKDDTSSSSEEKKILMRALSRPPFGNYRVWWSLADSKYAGTALFVKKCFQPKKECNIEEITDEDEPPPKSSKSKKENGPEKSPSLVFKITSKVPYKTILKAHSVVVLKAESTADKTEWLNKLRNVIQPSGQVKGESGLTMRQSLSDGSLDTMARRPADSEEELRWMSQEVRGYVEAVLNSLAANVPKAIVLCQVEKSKEDMLNQLYSSVSAQSTARIEELLQEDQNVKRRRERNQKQSSLLAKLTKQLSIHDNRAAAASSSWSNGGAGIIVVTV